MKVPTRVNRYYQPSTPTERPINTPGILTPDQIANLEESIANQPRKDGVYFIKAGNAIKIGYSINVTDRMVNLQTGNHERLQLLGLLNIEQRYERLIRAQFEHLHLHNEWFRDAAEIRLYLLEHEALA